MSGLHDTPRLDADPDRMETEPYYEPAGGEVALFEAAWASRVPLLLKGPTSRGRSKFGQKPRVYYNRCGGSLAFVLYILSTLAISLPGAPRCRSSVLIWKAS